MNSGKHSENKIILFPGAFQPVANYGGYEGVDIWMGQKFKDDHRNYDCIIGHSGGANFALRYAANQKSEFILINPLVKKISVPNLVVRWLKFFIAEGIKQENIIPVKYWLFAFRKVLKIIKVDFLTSAENISRENLTVIRGRRDNFFCDKKAAKLIRASGIRLIEVDAGHDWNRNIAKAVRKLIFHHGG